MPIRLPPRPFLYPIVDLGFLAGRPVGPVVAALARGGARLLQIRAKQIPDGRFLAEAREALAAAREAGVLLIVNDRPDVARILAADGVHLGQDDLAPRDARSLLPAGSIVGLSTHNLDQLAAAEEEPVDYVAIGPVFPTATKERPDPVVGTSLIRRVRSLTARPIVAIGGITRARARSVVQSGADGVAVAADLLRMADLEGAAAAFIEALA